MAIQFETPELQTNESLQSFENTDSLAKSYLELHGRASTGDISLLPEDIRKDPSIAKYKNVNEVAKAYVEANKLIGGIKHAPGKAEEYKFTDLKDLHPGVASGVDGTRKFLAAQFHALDIDNERADKMQQAILQGLHNSMVKQEEARGIKAKEVESQLRNDWGAEYDKNKANVENIFKRLGVEDYGKEISSDPVKLKAIHKLTSMLSEDSVGKLGEGTQSSVDIKTKEGALKALEEFNVEVKAKGKEHPFYKGDAATVERYNKLLEVAYA